MKIGDNVKSYLENNDDRTKEELIRGLAAVFDYSNELALRVYKAWRSIYKLDDYKTIESQLTEKEIETLKKLDKIYKDELQKINWW